MDATAMTIVIVIAIFAFGIYADIGNSKILDTIDSTIKEKKGIKYYTEEKNKR